MRDDPATRGTPALEAVGLTRRFGPKLALDAVDLAVRPGEVRALLGPNGAGKTTLLRVLSGLVDPTAGHVAIGGRRDVGLVPAGDRTFYLRISALENLVFFGRLHGMRRREAVARAREVLEQVQLLEDQRVAVGRYSHGMQKRLSVARALLVEPPVLLVDEATHDLDPVGARQVRSLVRRLAARGTAVLWTTQRLDEIGGFADSVTVLNGGRRIFAGSVPELMVHAVPRRFLLQLGQNGGPPVAEALPGVEAALAGGASFEPAAPGSHEHYVLTLSGETVLGDAMGALVGARVHLVSCRQERSEVEEAFLSLTQEPAAP